MDGAIGASVGYAIGIAISPIPIAALLLTLLSIRPRANSIAFTLGWVAGIAGVSAVATVTPLFDADDDPSDRRGWIRLTVGMLLVLAAGRRWRKRPVTDRTPTTPSLMRTVDRAGTLGALAIGFALAALNPKDALLAAAGGAEIGSADLGGGATFAALVVFTTIAASTAIAPVVAYLVVGERLDERLRRSRAWLVRNNPTVVAVVLAGLGVLLAVEGIQILRS